VYGHLVDGAMQHLRAQSRAVRAAAVQSENRRDLRRATDRSGLRVGAERTDPGCVMWRTSQDRRIGPLQADIKEGEMRHPGNDIATGVS